MGVTPLTREKKLSFDEMCKINPVLRKLERLCQLVNTDWQNQLSSYWYDTIKPVMVQNVGDAAPHPELKGSTAYDVAYEHLVKTLGMED